MKRRKWGSCKICGKKFKGKIKLRIHIQKVHRSIWKDCGDKSKSKSFIIVVNKNMCNGCDNKVKQMRYFSIHIEMSHRGHRKLTKSRFGDAKCDGYWCNCILKIHIKHHKKSNCNMCAKSSRNLKGMKMHIRNAHRISCKSWNTKFKEKGDW